MKSWLRCANPLPLDAGGPSHIPYEPFSDEWSEKPISERFEHIVATVPDNVAVVDGSICCTYRELHRQARRLACRIEKVVSPEAPVVLLLPTGRYFVIAALACLFSGRPYLPVDTRNPAMRVREIIEDAGAFTVISLSGDAADESALGELTFIRLGQAEDRDDNDVTFASRPATIDAPALILTTSGSTGKPKGVAISQRAILHRVSEATNSCHLHNKDRIALFVSPGTIAGTREMFSALLNGATLYPLDPQRSGVRAVLHTLKQAGITACYIVPALQRLLMHAPGAREAFARMRILRIGGDITLASDLMLFRRLAPNNCYFYVSFSSTEMPAAFQWFVPSDWEPDGLRIPVGYHRPVADLMLVDEDGRPVDDGQVGQLVVRSRYLASGWWRNGALQPFALDPTDASKRILHTGDMVKQRKDGLWDLTGRSDRQIKLHGQRINPGDVEASLRNCSHVTDVAVITRIDNDTAVALVAFVVLAEYDTSVLNNIRTELRSRLPQYMMPAEIHVVEAIPYLLGFKVDVKNLEALDLEELARHSSPDLAENGSVPVFYPDENMPLAAARKSGSVRSAVESAWGAVLGKTSLTLNRRWEETEGDSLKAMEMWFRIEQSLGRSIDLEMLRADTTPERLIAEIEAGVNLARIKVNMEDIPEKIPVVYLFPGTAGDEPVLSNLRTALREKVQFKLITYPDWRALLNGEISFKRIVDEAYDRICQDSSQGAYCLAGYSFGGFVAFEVARRLTQSGRPIGYLGLIDSRMPEMARIPILQRVVGLVKNPGRVPIIAMYRMQRLMIKSCMYPALKKLTTIAISNPNRLAYLWHRHLISWLHMRTLESWDKQPLNVDATLYTSDINNLNGISKDYGWRSLCRSLKMVAVGGTHRSMLQAPRAGILISDIVEAVRDESNAQVYMENSFAQRVAVEAPSVVGR